MDSEEKEFQAEITAFQENWNHAKHVENERLQFTQIYGGIVAGVFAITNVLNTPINQNILWILFFIGSVGFILSLKLTYEFKNHVNKIEGLLINPTLKKHVGMQLSGGVFSLIKVRYMILIFYVIMCGFLLYLLVDYKWIFLQICLMVALVVFSDIEFRKRLKINEIASSKQINVDVLRNIHFWNVNTLYQEVEKQKTIEKISKIDTSKQDSSCTKENLDKMSLKELKKTYKKIIQMESKKTMESFRR